MDWKRVYAIHSFPRGVPFGNRWTNFSHAVIFKRLDGPTTEDPRNSESIFKNILLNRSEVVDFQVIVCLSYWSTSTEIVFKTLSSSLVKPRSKTRRLFKLITISPIFFTVAFSGKISRSIPVAIVPWQNNSNIKFKCVCCVCCQWALSAVSPALTAYHSTLSLTYYTRRTWQMVFFPLGVVGSA